MDIDSAVAIAERAHRFITQVAAILTDEPEFAAVKIADLYADQGEQLEADAARLT